MDKPEKVEVKTYRGNCHCGAFKFTVSATPLNRVYECNCSNCSRHGALWLLGVTNENLVIERGEGILKEYIINLAKGNVVLLFCPTCGTSVMERKRDGSPVLNVRAFVDVDLEKLDIIRYDMATVPPPYEPPPVPEHHKEMQPGDGQKLYHGNCHCGKVVYTVASEPIEELEVMSCNCSSCSRNGDLWIYPRKSAVKSYGEENLVEYEFLHKSSLHSFCGTCGVSILVNVTVPGSDIVPINVRTLNSIDLGSLKLKRFDGWSRDPQYSVD